MIRVAHLAAVLLAALATLAASSSPAQAPPGAATRPPAPIRALEQAIETRSGALLLPGDGVGTVTVMPCAGCRPLGLLAGSSTVWMLGERAVRFEELSRVLQAGPRVPVMLFYRGNGLELTRLVARVREEAPR